MANATAIMTDRPIDDAVLDGLRAGDSVEITGRVLTLRDASAARIASVANLGQLLPVVLEGQVLYAVGPSPAKPGDVIGSAGPTTTSRMSRYLPMLLAAGVTAIIGKGELRGHDATAFVQHGAIYLAAVGGLGALLARHIEAATVVAYEDLGAEALYALQVRAFPAVVIIDRAGRNHHEIARAQWRRDQPARHQAGERKTDGD
jgi:fumarate hydratase subunit beta